MYDNSVASEQKAMDRLLVEYEDSVNGDTEGYNWAKGVNKPKLSSGMIPIKFQGGNWVVTNEGDEGWYEYIEDKKWANVMLSDGTYKAGEVADGTVVEESQLGSMFVWIPRYAYSIREYKVEKDNTEGSSGNITDITFLKGVSNRDEAGNSYLSDYDEDSVPQGEATPSIVHPAFKFDGKEVTGIWVAKFESSMLEGNLNTTDNNDVTDKTVRIIPNSIAWRNIRIGKIMTNCLGIMSKEIYGINNTADSHLLKNTEWGAVAYLAASSYGTLPTYNNSKDSLEETSGNTYTGGGDYIANVTQSTTGNVTGIYDLNGGGWEAVAAYYDTENGQISLQGTYDYFSDRKVKTEYEKYWDIYETSDLEKSNTNDLWSKDSSYNNIRMEITNQRYELLKGIKGDALYEVINTYSYFGKKEDEVYGWGMEENFSSAQYGKTLYNQDYTLLGNTALSFICRGGSSWTEGDGSLANLSGIFASFDGSGGASADKSFRPTLIVN